MLVLTRKLMEKLFIGDDICITVVRLEGGQVRLGIDAPREVSVVRAELVPERQGGPTRGGHGQAPVHGHGPAGGRVAPPTASPAPAPGPTAARGDGPGPVRIPPIGVHETDSRRRGRSR